jgi:hypothetical protein
MNFHNIAKNFLFIARALYHSVMRMKRFPIRREGHPESGESLTPVSALSRSF